MYHVLKIVKVVQCNCTLSSLEPKEKILLDPLKMTFRPKKIIICFSGTFLENDMGGRLFIFNFFNKML